MRLMNYPARNSFGIFVYSWRITNENPDRRFHITPYLKETLSAWWDRQLLGLDKTGGPDRFNLETLTKKLAIESRQDITDVIALRRLGGEIDTGNHSHTREHSHFDRDICKRILTHHRSELLKDIKAEFRTPRGALKLGVMTSLLPLFGIVASQTVAANGNPALLVLTGVGAYILPRKFLRHVRRYRISKKLYARAAAGIAASAQALRGPDPMPQRVYHYPHTQLAHDLTRVAPKQG